MTQNTFDLTLAQTIVESEDQFPIYFEEAWQWLEFSTKGNAKKSFDKAGFIENIDFEVFIQNKKNPLGGRPLEIIKMSIECFKLWAMMVNTQKGNKVRLYFLECEKIAKDKIAQAITQEVNAVEKVQQFGAVMDTIFANVNIHKELIAGRKLNYAQKLLPDMSSELEEQRQLLINSTSTDKEAFTPTSIGKMMTPPISARRVNSLLLSGGYQIKNPNKHSQRDMTYIATDKGLGHSTITLATGANKDDTYQQLRWYDTILSLI